MDKKFQDQKNKINEKIIKDARSTLSLYTIQLFEIGMTEVSFEEPKIVYSLVDEINYIQKSDWVTFENYERLKSKNINDLIMSGKFNSVLGIEGLRTFSLEYVETFNSGALMLLKSNDGRIKQSMYENGIFIEYESATDKLKRVYDQFDHRNLHRRLLLDTSLCFANGHRMSLDRISFKDIQSYSITEKDFQNFSLIMSDMAEDAIEFLSNFMKKESKIDLNYFRGNVG